MTAPADETENEENLDAAAPENAEGGQGGGESGGDEEDDLAAEWGAALGEGEENAAAGGEDGGEGGQTRVLNQDEIDSLLGFDETAEGEEEQTGMQAILNSALVSYERLPMLEVVFDRLVRLMSTSLRNFTSDNVEVSLDSIASIRFGDYLNSIPLPAMISVFKAEEWDNHGPHYR